MKGELNIKNIGLLNHLFFSTIIILFYSCQEPEPFPITPQIQFANIEYVEIVENGNPDSLILEFNFQDGDGDLGIEGDENLPPFHDFNFIVDRNNKIVTIGQPTVDGPLYYYTPGYGRTQELNSTERPAFDCAHYDTLYINETRDRYIPPGVGVSTEDLQEFHKDTVFIQRNPYKNNIIVKFYRKRGPENYEEINWRYLTSIYGCGITFDGRFPVLDVESWASAGPLQGSIRYAMVSTGFRTVLRKDTFNIKFQVIDRALHGSDVAETGDITLDQLIR